MTHLTYIHTDRQTDRPALLPAHTLPDQHTPTYPFSLTHCLTHPSIPNLPSHTHTHTYSYHKAWRPYRINSLFFDSPLAYHNPQVCMCVCICVYVYMIECVYVYVIFFVYV